MASTSTPMNDQQIQLPPPRTNGYQLTQGVRSRSLPAQVSTVLLQPGVFFRTLPALAETRSWLWAAVLVLLLIGLSAVQRASLEGSGTQTPDGGVTVDPGFGGDIGVPSDGIDLGGPPSGFVPQPTDSGTAGGSVDVASTWTTALVAASGVVLGWGILTVLLSEASLLRGYRPQLGRNLQIAIWASLPLGLMSGLQLVYYGAGGAPGQAGIAGLLPDLPGYADFAPLVKNLLHVLFSQFTLFWLWSLLLVYAGGRWSLGSRGWMALLVVLMWVAVQVIVPVATGAVNVATDSANTAEEPGFRNEVPPGIEDRFGAGDGVVPPGEMPSGAVVPEMTEAPAEAGDNAGGQLDEDETVTPSVEAQPPDAELTEPVLPDAASTETP